MRRRRALFYCDSTGSLFSPVNKVGLPQTRLASLAYKHKFSIAKKQHAIARIRELFAKVLGYDLPKTSPDYGIANVIPRLDSGTYLVFIHSASRTEKLWPEDNWIKLANKSDYKIKLPWGNEKEKQRAERIAAKCNNVEVLPK